MNQGQKSALAGRRSEEVAAFFRHAHGLHVAGNLAAAAEGYRQVLAMQPQHLDALHLLGLVRLHWRDFDAAKQLIEQALQLRPDEPALLGSLGETLRQAGDAAAEPVLRRALAAAPGNVDAMNNLGALLTETDRTAEAETWLREGLARRPNDPTLYYNLARTLAKSHQVEAAIATYRAALLRRPHWPDAINACAMLLKNSAQVDAAFELLQEAFAATGERSIGHNLLLTSCYVNGLVPKDLLRLHRQVADQLGLRHPPEVLPERGELRPDSLHIGLVSADFREHPVSFFLLPLLRGLQGLSIRVTAYSNHAVEDGVTQTIRACCSAFVRIDALDDAQAWQRIRDDGVDVLVDLAGFTGGNRIELFARRAAPLQVSWIGYLASTGLACFDAHLADAIAVPASLARDGFAEPVANLPGCQWCYSGPPIDLAIQPREVAAPLVFGAFHSGAKLGAPVLAAWASLLAAIPDARLLLMVEGGDTLRTRIAANAPEADLTSRISVRAPGSLTDYLAAHNEVDVILDAFPYSGATTTFHALWMGTPVLALAGDHPAGRSSLSILSRLGMADWVAETAAELLTRALALTADRAALRAGKPELRQRLETSELMDGERFARGFVETLMRLPFKDADPS